MVCHFNKNPDPYKPFYEPSGHEKTWEMHVQNMAKDGTWAGQTELSAIGRRYDTHFVVVSANAAVGAIEKHQVELGPPEPPRVQPLEGKASGGEPATGSKLYRQKHQTP